MREGPRFTGERAGASSPLRWAVWLLVPAAVLAAPAAHAGLRALGLGIEFPQTLRRCLLVSVVVALLASLRPWRDVPPDLWGLRGPRARPSLVGLGVLLAVSMLLTVVLVQAATGRFRWDTDEGARKFWQRLPATLAGAVLIGVLEEAFFRGWLLSRLRRRLALGSAVALGALLFALPHAFRATAVRPDLPATLAGSLEAFAAWGRNAADLADFGPRFVGLLLLATLLSAAFLRVGSLLLPIGIHGGAHVFLQQASALTDRQPERDWMGSKWLYDGPLVWAAMAALAWALWPRRAAGPGDPPSLALSYDPRASRPSVPGESVE